MKQGSKNLLLLLGFILLLFTAYQYSFSKTFEIKKELNQLHLQISENSRDQINQYDLSQREKFLDSIIKQNISSSSLQNDLLAVINKNSKENNIKIISFNEPHTYAFEDKTLTNSYRFVLEGNYENLEGLLYNLELNHSFGAIAHISFERKKDFRLNKEFLQCSVLVQHVK